MKNTCLYYFLVLIGCLTLSSCKEEEYAIPTLKQELQNDVIKRTLGPNLVGMDIEFAYAMALPKSMGKLVSAEVEATIAGGESTYLESRSFYTNGSGEDVGIEVGSKSVNSGGKTTVTFTKDTSAATLRYFYRIPGAAKGKEVSFKFSAQASNGQSVSYSMGPYKVAEMDLVLDLDVVDSTKAFISIEDMAVYTAATAGANASKIDLVYLYRSIPNITFSHGLVAPSAKTYLPSVILPAGATRNTKVQKVWNLRDFHLARLQYGVYIDDLDFQQLNISTAPNYAINMRAEAGVWVETEDGKYRAYVYVNSVNNSGRSAKISIKRYQMK
ncbi:DUF4466 family protein [Dyadobacter chenhuakuii]|uniref:DUF4466 family protein n=1 Tax=Dyadobacter chenhuakuii TaxID=2909339 RepID=A0ABY4XLF3_9BACT|nr:DUF4466 family protein [Dyadobacter chenhuakuii]MCF2494142.1 DUF4466 family protein [Dyadobacter chenhuakuii]USJ31270.1 DUF4466 family protein [Dyadobacter chenhuakuii]